MSTIGSALDHKQEIKVKLGDDEYTVNPLTLTDVYTHFESKITQKAIEDAKLVSNALPPEDRVTFMTQVWKDLPTGEDMENKISTSIQSIDGIQEIIFIAIQKIGVAITMELIKRYVNVDTLENYLDVFYRLIGITPGEDDEEVEVAPGKKSQS